MSHAILHRYLPGAGLDAFLQQFKVAAARDPFGTILIVPTSHLAREILHRLEDEGVPVVADAITTLPGFARKIYEEDAATETLLSDAESRLILSHELTTHASRFPLLSGIGTVDELAILFSVLIMRKVDYPDALGDLQSEKSAEIKDLFDAYLRFLDEHSLIDANTLFSWANKRLSGAGGTYRTVFVYGLFEPMPLEQELLLALRRSADVFYYALPFADNPAVFADDGSWLTPDTIITGTLPGDRQATMAGLFSRQCSWDSGGSVRIAERRDILDEVRAIAQEIRNLCAGGVRPADITVAFPAFEPAIPYVEEVFSDFQIPYAASGGQVLLRSPLVRSLLCVLTVPMFGYRREDVVALVKSPYMRFARDSHDIDLLSRDARIVAGADAWGMRLAGLAATLEGELAGTDTPDRARERVTEKIAALNAVRKKIRRLFSDLATLEGTKTIAGHIAAYRSLLESWDCPAMPKEGDPGVLEQEARDLEAFIGILDTLERFTRILPDQNVTLAEFSSLLSLLATETRPPRKRTRNAVNVVGIREIGHLSIPYLFIANLVEGVMPRLTTRLPFTTDLETRRLGTRSKGDILREERYHFIAALLAATGRIYLSFSSADGGSPLISSGFVDAVKEQIASEPWGETKFPHSRIAAAREAGALLSRGEFAGAVAGLPPGLPVSEAVRRQNIENYYRRGAYDSAYDGLLSGDPKIVAALAGRYGENAVFSPTALEVYADCPFRYYLGRVIGLEPLPAVDLDLTALERGSLVHRVAFRFYSDWEREMRCPITEERYSEALRQILAIGREEADRFAYGSPAWTVEREFLLGSPETGRGLLERFLGHELETAASTFVPQAFELSFGLPVTAGTCDPASTPDAVTIPLGGETVRIRGRIDRVDRLPDGRFLITDYKTGSTIPSLNDIRAGKALQLPLYIRAAEMLTFMQGVAGSYYILRRGDIRNKPVFWDASLKEQFGCFPGASRCSVADVREMVDGSLAWVKRYLLGIRDGWFMPRSDPGPCPRFCNFRTVCRFDCQRLLSCGEVNADGTD